MAKYNINCTVERPDTTPGDLGALVIGAIEESGDERQSVGEVLSLGVAEDVPLHPDTEVSRPFLSIKTSMGMLIAKPDSAGGMEISWNKRRIAVIEAGPGAGYMRVVTWPSGNRENVKVEPIWKGNGE